MITNRRMDLSFKLYPAPQRPSDSLPLAAARCYLVKTRGAARRLCSARPSQPRHSHRARTLGPAPARVVMGTRDSRQADQ